jgi:psp operon transcriptional activator
VGGSRSIKVDVRLLAATNEDLPSLADSGEFRADLLDRLAFDVITLPPLRERKEDILMLAENFAINMARELEMELFSGFTEKAKRILLDYHWPGNIRELKNTVERAVYRSNNPHLPVHQIILDPFESAFRPKNRTKTLDRISTQPATLSEHKVINEESKVSQPSPDTKKESTLDFPVDLKELSQNFEIDLINNALADSQFNQKKTAEKLGLTYHQLRGYLKKYNLLENADEDDG